MPGSPRELEFGLLDTSVFIGRETGRPLGPLSSHAAISVVTLAELHLGVLMADDPAIRTRRLGTLSLVEATFDPLPMDAEVGRTFAAIVAAARRQGRRPKIMDAWIAATAVTHDLPVYIQDDEFRVIPRVRHIRG